MERKYGDAIAVLSEIILNQRRISQQLDWQIESLKSKISKLEKELDQRDN